MRTLLTVTAIFMTVAATPAMAADAAMGKRQFSVCSSCHTTEKGGQAKIGPNLNGVIGRKAGTGNGFSYSDAMTKSSVVWDDKALDQYLTKPGAFIPGNKMAFIGAAKPEVRANIIAYLKEATK